MYRDWLAERRFLERMEEGTEPRGVAVAREGAVVGDRRRLKTTY